jgi:antitoxin ParD1/3/4
LIQEVPKVDITLSPEMRRFVEGKIKSGRYASAAEAVNDLLSVAKAQEELTPDDIRELRAEIDIGLAEADRGDFVQFTAEDIIAEKRAALARRKGR